MAKMTEQDKAYAAFAGEAKSENIAILGRRDWVLAGEPASLTDWRIANGTLKKAVVTAIGERKPRQPIAAGTKRNRPSGGTTGQVWDIADSLVVDGKMPERTAILDACVDAGINRATAATQFASWKRFQEQ